MVTLKEIHPIFAGEFPRGNFVITQIELTIFAKLMSHCCHQGRWGVICVTEDPSPLRWMVHVAGPKVSHLVAQYETECGTNAGN